MSKCIFDIGLDIILQLGYVTIDSTLCMTLNLPANEIFSNGKRKKNWKWFYIISPPNEAHISVAWKCSVCSWWDLERGLKLSCLRGDLNRDLSQQSGLSCLYGRFNPPVVSSVLNPSTKQAHSNIENLSYFVNKNIFVSCIQTVVEYSF